MKNRRLTDKVDLSGSPVEFEFSKLMRSSLEGDSEAYRNLLQKVQEMISPFVANMLYQSGRKDSDGYEDVVQEILLALHAKRNTYDAGQFFLPWMYAIARYKTIDFLRRHKMSLKHTPIEDLSDILVDPLESLKDCFHFELELQSLCEKLPSKQRDVLLMVKVEGLSVQEVCARTGFSASDIKVTVHRAIKSLRDLAREVKI